MAKETDGRGRATMNEADIDYLRNIDTRPGPGAGHSIDPSKPGPDNANELAKLAVRNLRAEADRIDPVEDEMELITKIKNYDAPPRPDKAAWLANEKADLVQSNAEPIDRKKVRFQIKQKPDGLWQEVDAGTWWSVSEKTHEVRLLDVPALAQSDAEPVVLDPIMWEACECLAEWADVPNVTKYAFSIHKRTLEVLPKFKAVLDAGAPRPDASAGLIEAAESVQEIAHDFARDIATNCGNDVEAIAALIERAILRARAADRSEK